MILLWIKLTIQCFLCDRSSYHFLYFSLVSNWPWFLELFLCLLHLFYLSFWNWYTVYKFRYGLLSIVVLEFYLPIVEEKFCLQINPTRNKIFFEVVYEFLYTFILCWTKWMNKSEINVSIFNNISLVVGPKKYHF